MMAEGAHPYWIPTEAVLLYALVPLVILSAIVLFLAPGMLLAIAAGRGTTVPVWLLSAVPFSLGSAMLLVELTRVLLTPATMGVVPGLCMLGWIGVTTAIASVVSRRRAVPWPVSRRNDWFPLVAAAIGVIVIYLGLTPKFLWESFNGDGAHAFEISRILLHQPWPFFPASAGPVSVFPGTTSMLFAFPNAWFIRLLGPIEPAVRVPWLVYLPLTVLGLQALAEAGVRRLERRTQAALWVGLMPFVFAMAFSATYSPYHADIALPAVQDTLLVVCFLGFLHAMVRREWSWVAAFGLLTYISLPNGFLLMGFWLLAELLVMRPRPWGVATRGALLMGAFLLVAAGFVAVLRWSGQTLPGGEYGFARTIPDLLRIDITQWRRGIYLLVGGAIFPVATLVLWRAQDHLARRVTLVVLGYFLLFSVQARFSLHHLVPAMLLPLVVAARLPPNKQPAANQYHFAWLVAALVAVVLSLPSSFAVVTAARQVGMRITQDVGSYDASDPAVFAASKLLGKALPYEWDPQVPTRAYGGSALAWLHYARAGRPDGRTTYHLTRRDAMAGSPAAPFTADSLFRLDVLDARTYADHLALRPPTNTHAPIYQVPRASLYGINGPNTINLTSLLTRVGRRIGLGRPEKESP